MRKNNPMSETRTISEAGELVDRAVRAIAPIVSECRLVAWAKGWLAGERDLELTRKIEEVARSLWQGSESAVRAADYDDNMRVGAAGKVQYTRPAEDALYNDGGYYAAKAAMHAAAACAAILDTDETRWTAPSIGRADYAASRAEDSLHFAEIAVAKNTQPT